MTNKKKATPKKKATLKKNAKVTNRMPKAGIELTKDGGFRIHLKTIRKSQLLDQGGDVLTAAGQGCISSPNGPRC